MNQLEIAARELAEIYDDYFQLSKHLQADGNRILDDPKSDQSTRRNLIRVSFPMIEAYSNTLRMLCKVLGTHTQFSLTKRQVRLLDDNDRTLTSPDRLKESLKLAFKIHEFDNEPSFSDKHWQNVLCAFSIRERITHPKRAAELIILDDEWGLAHQGLLWVLQTFSSFISQVHENYGRTPE